MKCKKIFAMLLALCMVLTTFVAVSAEDVVVVDINEDYETDIGDTICGGDISLDTVGFEGENVLKVTSSYSGAAGWQSLVGFALKDTDGTQLTIADLPEDGVIEYSFDIYVPTEGGNVGDATAYLRTANGFPPAGMQTRLDELNGLTTGEWITYEGTKNVSDNSWAGDSGSDAPIWICLRANFSAAGTFYMDNFSFTLTQTVEEEEPEYYNVIDFEAAIDDASEITHTGTNVSVENADGIGGRDNVVKATGVDSTNNGTAGVKFGGADFKFEVGDIITYSFDYYAEEDSNPCIWLRKHTPTLTPFRGYIDTFNVEANAWTTLTKTLTVTDDTTFWSDTANFADGGQFAIYVRGGASECYLDNISVTVQREGTAPDEGGDEPGGDIGGGDDPIIPSDEITFVLERAVNAGSNGGNDFPAVGEVNEDVFTATLRNVREYTYNRNGGNESTMGGDCGYQPWVWIMLDEDLQTSDDWYVSYDLTTEGIINSVGGEYETLKVRTRFYNENSELCGHSDHLLEVDANKGEPVNVGVQVDTSKVTGTVTKIGLVLDIGSSVKYNDYEGSDAYFEISNVVVDYGTYVAPDEGGDEPGGEDPITPPPGGGTDGPGTGGQTPSHPGDPEYVAISEQSNDFTVDMGDVQVGTTNIAGEIVDLDGENVLKVTSSGTTSHNGVIGIVIKDSEGNKIKFTDLQSYDRVSWSVDIMMEDTSALPAAGDGAYVGFRYGSWTPANAMVNAGNIGGSILTPGQWKTMSGTKPIGELNWQSTAFNGDVYFFVRPNFTTNAVMYIDNIEVTVEKEFVPTIASVTIDEVGADNVTLNVQTDGAIEIDSLADYILIDGAAVNTENVSVEAVDSNDTTVTIIGLAPGTEYEIAVTGALNARDREVGIANEADCTVSVTTVAEVDVEAGISNDTVSFSLTNNLSETETIHVVLLRCKGNTVIETIATVVEAAPGEPIEDSVEVTELGAGEYYRVFAWSYEDGAINSMAKVIDLD